jgi:hypothetical protein
MPKPKKTTKTILPDAEPSLPELPLRELGLLDEFCIPEDWSREQLEDIISLGVSEDDLRVCPRISHVLRRAGSKDRIFELLAGSEEADARKIVQLVGVHGIARWRRLPLEVWALATGITTKRLFGLVAQELFDTSRQEGLLMAASRHPDVVQAATDSALQDHGVRDREMLFKHNGFLPVPKTSFINAPGGRVNVGDHQTHNTQQVAVLAPMEGDVRKLSDRFNLDIIGARAEEPPPVTALLDVSEDEFEEAG